MIEEFDLNITDDLVTKCFEIAGNIKTTKLNSITSFHSEKKCLVHIANASDYELYKGYLRPNDFYCTELIDSCILDVKKLMEFHGFQLDDTNNMTNCEFHYGKSCNENDIVTSVFPIHRDDFGGTEWPTVTFIIYIDVNCSGGELGFYSDDSSEPNCIRVIKTSNPSSTTRKVVIFDGSIFHKVNDFSNGYRCAISFQLPRKLTEN